MNNIIEGSKQLLSESIDLLGDSIKDIVIVGGWGPYLRHSEIHPGTKDVDILFPEEYTRHEIERILENFLDNKFFIGAKYDFQLCRAYQIGKRTYIYNVDLLHPTEGKIDKVDFIEILNLDVTKDGIRVKTLITVNIQYGDVIYSEILFENIDFEGKSLNVLDGAGIVVSKINSCHKKNRQRDIYDIYLSLKEKSTLEKINHLGTINPNLNNNFSRYADLLKNNWEVYEDNLKSFGIYDPKAQEILLMGR